MTGSRKKEIYDVPNSGWSSPDWNWGYGVGTGHDCALICRDRYATKASRAELIDSLMQGASSNNNIQFEEVKLILALAWQRGRWDGSDGGPDGYGHVLAAMASAERYEVGTEQACSMRFVQDIRDRFHLLNPTDEDREAMEALSTSMVTNVDGARLRCAGLVLKAMRFVEGGL